MMPSTVKAERSYDRRELFKIALRIDTAHKKHGTVLRGLAECRVARGKFSMTEEFRHPAVLEIANPACGGERGAMPQVRRVREHVHCVRFKQAFHKQILVQDPGNGASRQAPGPVDHAGAQHLYGRKRRDQSPRS